MSVVYKNGKVIYDPPLERTLTEKANRLVLQFTRYAQGVGLSADDIYIQRFLVPRIILRVDKREGYFVVFHEGTRINEIKQAALMVYRILKFKPFAVKATDPNSLKKYSRINESFALFYLLSACKQYSVESNHTTAEMSERLCNELLYAFSYWDLSKESLILIAETIAEACFGISAQGI